MDTGTIFAILFGVALVAALGRLMIALVTAWFDYRLRLRLLEDLERDPELTESPEESEALFERLRQTRRIRPSFLWTGLFLLTIGAAAAGYGSWQRTGQVAVGTYWGGWICVWLGAVLAALGAVGRLWMRRGEAKARQGLKTP
jgi:hypothetical protein